MQDLFSKVTKGKFPPIPQHYSAELSRMISFCLQTNPLQRPSAEEIAQMPTFMNGGKLPPQKQQQAKRSNSQNVRASSQDKIDLLKTIKLPRNLKNLNNGLLPKKNYEGSDEEL